MSTIQGIEATSEQGRVVIVACYPGDMTFKHYSGTCAPSERLNLPGGTDLTIEYGGFVAFIRFGHIWYTLWVAANPMPGHLAASDPHTGYQKESEKGVASGYASLDGTTKVPYAQLPTGTVSSTVAIGDHAHSGVYEPSGAVSTHEGASNPHPTYETAAEVAAQIGTHASDADAHHTWPLTTADIPADIPRFGHLQAHEDDGDAHAHRAFDDHSDTRGKWTVTPEGDIVSAVLEDGGSNWDPDGPGIGDAAHMWPHHVYAGYFMFSQSLSGPSITATIVKATQVNSPATNLYLFGVCN